MATFTASVDLNMRWLGNEISGAAGATHRIPDALADEFASGPGTHISGFAWVAQDESTAYASSGAVSTAISAHSISATGHSHFSLATNPHSVSPKQIIQVWGSADLSLDTVVTLSGGVGDAHLNSIAYDGVTIVTGTYSAGNVWVSRDQGMTWEDLGQPNGITALDDIAAVASPRPGQFFIGCSNTGGGSRLLRSDDSGATWLQVLAATTTQATEGLSLAGGFGRALFAGSYNVASNGGARIWRSTDNGDQWAIVSSTESTKTTIRQILHVGDGVYIAGVYGSSPNESKIYRSSDGGGTWASVQTIASEDVYAACTLPGGVVLLGTTRSTGGRIWRSTDIGASFTSVATFGTGAGTVTGLLRMGSKVLAFLDVDGNTESLIYVSADEGATWSRIGSFSASYHAHMPVAVDDRTIIVPLSRNGYSAAGQIARLTFYG